MKKNTKMIQRRSPRFNVNTAGYQGGWARPFVVRIYANDVEVRIEAALRFSRLLPVAFLDLEAFSAFFRGRKDHRVATEPASITSSPRVFVVAGLGVPFSLILSGAKDFNYVCTL